MFRTDSNTRGDRAGAPLADSLHTLRLSLRRLRRAPGFSAVVVATLAVGIGANTGIFSVVNGILLSPLPFDDSERLVSVWSTAPGLGEDILPQAPVLHLTYEEESSLIEDIGLWTEGAGNVLNFDEPARVATAAVSSGVFRALRIHPAIGRRFTPEDDDPASPRTVMLSHAYWQSRYGADNDVLGRTLSLDGVEREIIGVAPRDFGLFESDPVLYVPLGFDRGTLFFGNFSYRSLARLREGVTIEQATADFARLLPVAAERFPRGVSLEMLQEARAAPLLHPLKQDVVGDVGDVLWLLLGGVGIILLIACANVANLFLVRAESRERELAVRSALGASRRHVTGQFLVESMLLGLMGGVIGVGLAQVGLKSLLAVAPSNLPRLEEVGLDPAVLVFALAISVLSGLFFGAFPVLRYGSIDRVNALKEGGRGGAAGRDRHRTRNTLVVAQIALALVLLIGSGLMIRSFQSLRDVEPGFRDPDRVLSFGITIPDAEVTDLEQVALTHELIARRVAEVPGVESVGLSTSVPMDGLGGYDPIFVQDFPLSEGQLPPIRRFKWISPGYVETLENRLVAGRTLTWPDVTSRTPVVLVTENFAREYWGDPAAAVGKRISTGLEPGDWKEIIGVVGDVRDAGASQEAPAIVYWPMAVAGLWSELTGEAVFVPRRFAYVIRSDRVGSASFLAEVREAVWSINSHLPLASPRTLEVIVRDSMARTSFTLVMLGIAAAMALLLGAVGVYGVISYIVSQRTRELGVRMVLGAESGAIKRMVLGRGLKLAGVGVMVGLLVAVGLTRLMSGVLYGVSPLDPITYGLVAVGLSGIALAASYLPARRAARVDPMESIRAE